MMIAKPEPVCPEPKVFVGQIPLDCQQEQVFNLFSKYGQIKKCAVITGPDGRSKGCAMVTFERWAEAELAIEHENGTSNLGGPRTMLVKFADPPRGRGDGPVMGVAPKKLFVGQIPPHTSEAHIRTLFGPYGNITDVHVLNKGNAPGCAFVTFERWAQAEAAMAALNGQTVLEGATAPMVVKFADAKVQGGPEGVVGLPGQKRTFGAIDQFAPNKRTFTGGLGGNMANPMGMGSMGMMGYNPYAAAAAMGYDVSAMAAMGYGMGMMGMQGMRPGMQQGMASGNSMPGNGQAANPAAMMGGNTMAGMMSGMMGLGMMGGGMKAGGAAGMMGDQGPKAWKLFIGQVPFEANESDLWPIFSPLGNILELAILRSGGKSKGCAFLTYENRTDAEKAVRTLDGQVSVASDPRCRLLTVKYANSSQQGGGMSAMAM